MKNSLLVLQTFGATCAVGLSFPDGRLDVLVETQPNSHATHLPVFMQQLLEKHGLRPEDLGGVAVISGPGSYTGLRIGVSSAKGFCWGAQLPLIAVPTFDAMVETARWTTQDPNGHYLCTIDARRQEIYAAVYDSKGSALMEARPVILTEAPLPFPEISEEAPLYILGDGTTKTLPFLPEKNIKIFHSEHYLTGASQIAQEKLRNKDEVSLAYFEPFYLKSWGQ